MITEFPVVRLENSMVSKRPFLLPGRFGWMDGWMHKCLLNTGLCFRLTEQFNFEETAAHQKHMRRAVSAVF